MSKIERTFLNVCLLIFLFLLIRILIDRHLKRLTVIEIQGDYIDCKKLNKNYPPGKCRWALKVE
jgi:hypothetical protein